MSDVPWSEVGEIVWLTLRVTLAATALGALVGIPVGAAWGASARAGGGSGGHRVFRVLLYTLYSLPPIVAGLVGYLLLSRSGWLGGLHLLFTPAAIVLVETLLAAPLIAGLTLAAVADVPGEVREAIVASGASGARVRWLLSREARVGITSAVLVGMGRTLAEVAGALLVGGNIRHETRTVGTAILQEVGQGDFAFALVLGFLLLAIALALVLALAWLQGRQAEDPA